MFRYKKWVVSVTLQIVHNQTLANLICSKNIIYVLFVFIYIVVKLCVVRASMHETEYRVKFTCLHMYFSRLNLHKLGYFNPKYNINIASYSDGFAFDTDMACNPYNVYSPTHIAGKTTVNVMFTQLRVIGPIGLAVAAK